MRRREDPLRKWCVGGVWEVNYNLIFSFLKVGQVWKEEGEVKKAVARWHEGSRAGGPPTRG